MKVKRAICAGIVVLLLAATGLDASIVVVLGSRSRLLVGSDSRQAANGLTNDRACKIKVGTRGVFVATGSYPTALLEEMWAEGERLALTSGTAQEHLDALIKQLEAVRFSPVSRFGGAMAFVYWTETGPTIAGARLTSSNGRFLFERESRDWRSQNDFGAGFYTLGVAGTISTADLTKMGVSVQLVDTAVARASADASVGGPVDVVQIDTRGPRWIRQKPECRTR